MEFNRKFDFRAELVSETVSKQVFHYIQQQINIKNAETLKQEQVDTKAYGQDTRYTYQVQ